MIRLDAARLGSKLRDGDARRVVDIDRRLRQTVGRDNQPFPVVVRQLSRPKRLRVDAPLGAKHALDESLRLNIRFNGNQSRQTFWSKEALGDLALLEGKPDEARRIYEEIEVEMAQCFGEQNPDLLALREKLKSVGTA